MFGHVVLLLVYKNGHILCHLSFDVGDNTELVGVEESESEQPISESNDTPDNDVAENPTLQSCNPNSNPNLPKIHSRKFRE